jgi:RNA polymerase sigma factor (TIGR02999 family)
MPSLSSKSVSELLAQWHAGDTKALGAALPKVYDELRRLARHYMRAQRPDHTLQSTALVHEAYIRIQRQRDFPFKDRSHFVAICANMVRQILVDYARAHDAAKRDGGYKLALDDAVAFKSKSLNLVALDDALTELAKLNPQHSRIIELRFFGGLSIEDTAGVLELSPATVKRHWAMARLWLHHELQMRQEAS